VSVTVGELADAETEVVARPVRADGSSVTPAGRRLELAAGPDVSKHLATLGDLPLGSAVLTPAGQLRCAYLLHLVVRSSEEPLSEGTVRRALQQGLARMADWGLRSLTLPPLGVGAGGLEPEAAATLVADVLGARGLGPTTPAADGLHVEVVVETDYEHEVFSRALP
jgi:O-acetyl-ADP-ribose deacetylase (regulator of RNase III)